MKIKLATIFLIAFLVRLIALNQSLWLDEGVTARVVLHYSIPQIITLFSPADFHPPLFYIVEKIWTSVFGYSEVVLRFPSVIFSLITGWIVFQIGKFLKDETTGLWAALFFLFNPLIMYYSQEARMYAMVTCFLTAALYFVVRILKKTASKDIIFFNTFIFLSFLTFYGSIFLIASMYLYLLWKRKFKEFLLTVPGMLIAVLIISPLLYRQFMNSRVALGVVKNWSLVLGKASLKNLILIPVKFSLGRISFYPKILYYTAAGIWTGSVMFYFLRGVHKNTISLFLIIVSLALAFIVSFSSPMLEYFRFLYLAIPFVLVLSMGANKTWQRFVLLTGFCTLSFIYLLVPQFHREDWKSLAKNISANVVIYGIPSSMDTLHYYNPLLNVNDVTEINSIKLTAKNVAVIVSTIEVFGFDYKSALHSQGYMIKKIYNFRELPVEYWERK